MMKKTFQIQSGENLRDLVKIVKKKLIKKLLRLDNQIRFWQKLEKSVKASR